MKITKVSVEKVENTNPRMKGNAYVEIDDCFAIEKIRIIEKKDGTLFAAMPSKKMPNGKYKDTCHPINEETRKMFEEAILEEFNKIKDEEPTKQESDTDTEDEEN